MLLKHRNSLPPLAMSDFLRRTRRLASLTWGDVAAPVRECGEHLACHMGHVRSTLLLSPPLPFFLLIHSYFSSLCYFPEPHVDMTLFCTSPGKSMELMTEELSQ